MAWFRKNPLPEHNVAAGPPKRSVRQVVIFSHWWMSSIVVVHLETESANELWLTLNDEWTKFDTESREFASAVMANLLGGPERLISAGMLTDESNVSDMHISTSLGFGPEFYADDVPDPLFLGISLADRVSSGWVPNNEEELDELYEFFSEVSLFVGFFSPFKQVLKVLTDAFEKHQEGMSSEFSSRFAGALARGYSVVEGRLADGRNGPSDNFRSEIQAISSLPALNGYRRPSLATLQFLSRKGLRFLKRLEDQASSLAATRFKVNFLVGPQLNSSFRSKSINGDFKLEDRSLKYQQILTYILYGHLGLVNKDREARKVILGPRSKRHTLQLGPSFLENMDEDSKAVYTDWINDGLYTDHAPIARHALAVSKVLESAEFVWNLDTTTLIANSDSEELQREALRVYVESTGWYGIFQPETLGRVLDWVDEQFTPILFRNEFGSPSIQQWNPVFGDYRKSIIIQEWISKNTQRSLTQRELIIAFSILKLDHYNLRAPRASLLFQLIQQDKLPPLNWAADWPAFFDWTNDLLAFFGVKPNDDYPVGVLDVTNLEEPELLNYFAGILSAHWENWAQYDVRSQERIMEVLVEFADSKKPGSLPLIKSLLHAPELASMRSEIMELLERSEPGVSAPLEFLARQLEIANAEALIDALTLLGGDSFATFWRKYSKEVEQLIISNPGFPDFFWSNAEAIPLGVREQILSVSEFGPKVLSSVQPSSIGRMNSIQEELLINLVKKHTEFLNQDGVLRPMLAAASLAVNQLATDHVKSSNLFPSFWLFMLESNLPYPQSAALSYLESQIGDSGFAETLLMALDSNNQQARTLAIRVLSKVKTPSMLKQILKALVENRNSDTWSIVSGNLEKLDDPEKFQEFTRQVFLSKRKSRSVKESIKGNVDALITNVEDAVEQDVLIRMAFSSVARDREWALRRIALHQAEVAGTTVETSWKSGINV